MSDGTISKAWSKSQHISAAQEGTRVEYYSGLGNLFLTNSSSFLIPVFSSGFVSTVCLIICPGTFPRLRVRLLVYKSCSLNGDIAPAGFYSIGYFLAQGVREKHPNSFHCSPVTGSSSACADSISISPEPSLDGFFLLHPLVWLTGN